jgi:hypothetical protein
MLVDIEEGKVSWNAWRGKRELDAEVYDFRCDTISHDLFLVSTAFSEVKVFDVRTKGRAVKSCQLYPKGHINHYPLHAVGASADEQYVYAGDSIGHLTQLDFNTLRVIKKPELRSVGGIRDIQ